MPPKAKGAKAKRCSGKGDDAQSWLETRIATLTLELQRLGAFVPPPEHEPSSIIHGKGATEKRRLTGNTKATQKAMRSMHLQVLEQRVLQLERLLSGIPAPPAESTGDETSGSGGMIFGMEVPPGPWKGEGTDAGVCDSTGSPHDGAHAA